MVTWCQPFSWASFPREASQTKLDPEEIRIHRSTLFGAGLVVLCCDETHLVNWIPSKRQLNSPCVCCGSTPVSMMQCSSPKPGPSKIRNSPPCLNQRRR